MGRGQGGCIPQPRRDVERAHQKETTEHRETTVVLNMMGRATDKLHFPGQTFYRRAILPAMENAARGVRSNPNYLIIPVPPQLAMNQEPAFSSPRIDHTGAL
ncbi:MAG: hypothetical protein OXS35_07135 [Dehalococcoidia bacterium]|nr:hypothetical protein [Dehalococcoidia bacterium]